MKLKHIPIAILTSCVAFPAHSSNLPTPEDVQGIINVCGAGRSVEVIGELDLSFKKLFSGEISGEGKVTDIIGIISSIEDDNLKVQVFEMYLSCVMPQLTTSKSNTDNNSKVITPPITYNVNGDYVEGNKITHNGGSNITYEFNSKKSE